MTVVEHNDVDISKLFIWGRDFNIVSPDDKVEAKVYMRLLGDADMNRARVYALRKSAELRKNLNNPESDDALIHIRSIDELETDDIINYITAFSMREISNQAVKEVSVDRPKQPKSNATLKQMEKYQAEIDAYPAKVQKAVGDYIKKEVEKLKASITNESKEALHKRYKNLLVAEYCEQEALKAYGEMELFLGCYKDPDYKIRLWNSFEEYDNLDRNYKNQFRAAYNTLDIRMDELKKLQEATP